MLRCQCRSEFGVVRDDGIEGKVKRVLAYQIVLDGEIKGFLEQAFHVTDSVVGVAVPVHSYRSFPGVGWFYPVNTHCAERTDFKNVHEEAAVSLGVWFDVLLVVLMPFSKSQRISFSFPVKKYWVFLGLHPVHGREFP